MQLFIKGKSKRTSAFIAHNDKNSSTHAQQKPINQFQESLAKETNQHRKDQGHRVNTNFFLMIPPIST